MAPGALRAGTLDGLRTPGKLLALALEALADRTIFRTDGMRGSEASDRTLTALHKQLSRKAELLVAQQDAAVLAIKVDGLEEEHIENRPTLRGGIAKGGIFDVGSALKETAEAIGDMAAEQAAAEEAAKELAALATSDPTAFSEQVSRLAQGSGVIERFMVRGILSALAAAGESVPNIADLNIPVVSGMEGGIATGTQFAEDKVIQVLGDLTHTHLDQIPVGAIDTTLGALAVIYTLAQAQRLLTRRQVFINALAQIGEETGALQRANDELGQQIERAIAAIDPGKLAKLQKLPIIDYRDTDEENALADGLRGTVSVDERGIAHAGDMSLVAVRITGGTEEIPDITYELLPLQVADGTLYLSRVDEATKVGFLLIGDYDKHFIAATTNGHALYTRAVPPRYVNVEDWPNGIVPDNASVGRDDIPDGVQALVPGFNPDSAIFLNAIVHRDQTDTYSETIYRVPLVMATQSQIADNGIEIRAYDRNRTVIPGHGENLDAVFTVQAGVAPTAKEE